jgi:membrane protease YdiL (CAAX protease family)
VVPPKVKNEPRYLLVEISCAYALSVILTVVVTRWGHYNALLAQHTTELVAAVFLAIPIIILLRRRESLDDYGLPADRLWPELFWGLAVALVIFPPFWLAFRLWWGWELTFEPILPRGYWQVALANVVVVALPEEFFFRGYLLTRLDLRWRQRITLGGVAVGWSLPVTSLLFALGHYVVAFDPQRLAVFFPALLFGWLRLRRGSITAAVLFHALCNIFMDLLLVGHGLTSPQEYG